MPDIEERQRRRDDYLVALYDLSNGGEPLTWATHAQIAEQAKIPEGDVMGIGQFLQEERLVEFKTMAAMQGSVAITARGVRRAEDLIRQREQMGWLTNEQLIRALEPLLPQIQAAIATIKDDPELRAELQADLDGVERQTKVRRPNRGVIASAMGRINSVMVTLSAYVGLGLEIAQLVHGMGH